MKSRLINFVCLFVCFLSLRTWANNLYLRISSVDQISIDYYKIQVEVTWENSWNENIGAVNHDASWVFIKQKYLGSKDWSPSKIKSLESDDFEFSFSADSIAFLLESNCSFGSKKSEGTVTFEVQSVSDFELFIGGIELVFIPESSFYLGDGTSLNRLESPLSEPLHILSEKELKYGDDISSVTWKSVAGDVPLAFPKGYEAFYCMKYEISQFQFVDFINHLTYSEQQIILPISPDSPKGSKALNKGVNTFFNGIIILESGKQSLEKSAQVACDLNANWIANEASDGKELACNFISWQQTLYYLDWVGLRPMTELEYEKAARGSEFPVAREFAFGTPTIQDANILVYDSTEFETYIYTLLSDQGIGAHGYSGRQGPLRVGFAAKDTTNRLQSGASYWGVMELSGNLWEQTVGVNKINGLKFTASHGDGKLSALPKDWLPQSLMLRGGAWNSGISNTYRDLAVSDRYYFNLEDESAKNTTGARGVVSLKYLKP